MAIALLCAPIVEATGAVMTVQEGLGSVFATRGGMASSVTTVLPDIMDPRANLCAPRVA